MYDLTNLTNGYPLIIKRDECGIIINNQLHRAFGMNTRFSDRMSVLPLISVPFGVNYHDAVCPCENVYWDEKTGWNIVPMFTAYCSESVFEKSVSTNINVNLSFVFAYSVNGKSYSQKFDFNIDSITNRDVES
jgi:hypothetical protein